MHGILYKQFLKIQKFNNKYKILKNIMIKKFHDLLLFIHI